MAVLSGVATFSSRPARSARFQLSVPDCQLSVASPHNWSQGRSADPPHADLRQLTTHHSPLSEAKSASGGLTTHPYASACARSERTRPMGRIGRMRGITAPPAKTSLSPVRLAYVESSRFIGVCSSWCDPFRFWLRDLTALVAMQLAPDPTCHTYDRQRTRKSCIKVRGFFGVARSIGALSTYGNRLSVRIAGQRGVSVAGAEEAWESSLGGRSCALA
jgi:hypothetical protein